MRGLFFATLFALPVAGLLAGVAWLGASLLH